MPESSNMEQAISRALRANLEGLQRQAEDLHQAIADLVSACASSRPANALPPTLRAQAAAASLAATLEVFARFISSTGETSRRESRQEESFRAVATSAPEIPAEAEAHSAPETTVETEAHSIPDVPLEAAQFEDPVSAPAPVDEAPSFQEPEPAPIPFAEPIPEIHADSVSEELASMDPGTLPELEVSPLETGGGEAVSDSPSPYSSEPPAGIISAPSAADPGATESGSAAPVESGVIFDLNSLPAEQQEMHRRANRVAKVSMQDIQMLKPEQVKIGREHHDLCIRLKGEIEKARKEYERRFGPILGHGVDYFYHWMVEVLAAGDPEALGEYPYSSPALQR
jgi:hypothetical protein